MKKLISFSLLFISAVLGAYAVPVIPVKSDTALIKAVKVGNRKEIKRLLKKEHVAVNEIGIDQKTAMDVAVEFGDAKTAMLLSKYNGKMTRADNVAEFKSMLKYRGKRLLISFAAMFLFAGLVFWAFDVCVRLVSDISLTYLALAIPVGLGLVVYSGYEWSRLFKGISMYSKVEQNWMIQIPDIV